jgi:CBS domain-containing protein
MKACDLMRRPLVFLHVHDSVRDVARVFLDQRIGGAPVLDEAGNAVGVMTKTDLTRHDRECLVASPDGDGDLRLIGAGDRETLPAHAAFHVDPEEGTVEEWMTPKVFAVFEDAPLRDVTREMVRRRIHRIFVMSRKTRKPVGVITTMDLLGYLSRRLNHRGAAGRDGAGRGAKRRGSA